MKFKIEDREEINRLDKYLADNTDFSRSLIEKMIKSGNVLVNNECVKAGYRLLLDDEIQVIEGYKKEVNLVATKMDLNIVYEDEYLLVINKQSGLTVHPGSGTHDDTLVNGLLYYCGELSTENSEERPGIVHRIDKDTSGLMIVVKDNEAHKILAEDFRNKNIHREYIALVNGIFPSQSAKINAPIGKSKEDFRKQEVREGGKNAVTNLTVMKRYKKHTLLRLFLETGRTHQIRVHLQYIGYTIFNDPTYSVCAATPFGQFLHSATLEFDHPITKEKMHFNAPLPLEFEEKVNSLNEEIENSKK